MKRAGKVLILFVIGAGLYFEIELNWRFFANTLPVHWSMPILGGVLFVLLGGINNWLPWEMPLQMQAVLGAAACTAAEFTAGCILNIWLGLDVWDYSDKPFNLLGQICPQFSLAWLGLSIVAIVLDDLLRYWLFKEEKPHYTLV